MNTGESVTSAVVHSQIQITSGNQPSTQNLSKLSNINEDYGNRRNVEQIRINHSRGDIEEKSLSSHRFLDNTNPCNTNNYPGKDLTNPEQSLHHKPFLTRQENSNSYHTILPSQNGEIFPQVKYLSRFI